MFAIHDDCNTQILLPLDSPTEPSDNPYIPKQLLINYSLIIYLTHLLKYSIFKEVNNICYKKQEDPKLYTTPSLY